MQLEVRIKKQFLISGIMGSLVLCGIAFIILIYSTPGMSSPWRYVVQALQVIIILFSIPNAILGIRRLIGSRIGLRISDEGVSDITVANAGRMYLWKEIKAIRLHDANQVKIPFIAIELLDPDIFMHGKIGVARKILQTNIAKYGTPVVIRPTVLDIDPHILLDALREGLDEFTTSQVHNEQAEVIN